MGNDCQGLELLDTPGVLWPKFDDPSVGFALAVTGAIKEDVFDREQAVELLLDLLIRKYPQDLQNKYAVSLEQGDDVNAVMAKIAVARGCLKSGGQLDIDKVVQLVLRDFRAGRLGRFYNRRALICRAIKTAAGRFFLLCKNKC